VLRPEGGEGRVPGALLLLPLLLPLLPLLLLLTPPLQVPEPPPDPATPAGAVVAAAEPVFRVFSGQYHTGSGGQRIHNECYDEYRSHTATPCAYCQQYLQV